MQNLGSVISGTMRVEDLLPAFADELKAAQEKENANNPAHLKLVKEAEELDNFVDEEVGELLDEIVEALQDYAPAYAYFGSHPGDGADYGFWLVEDFQQEILANGGVGVNDSSELDNLPEDVIEALEVNDHGNCTLYLRTNKENAWEVIWAVV